MSEEIEDIDDDGGLLNRLGNILEKAATSPAGIGLLSVLIGGLLKSTHGVNQEWRNVMGPFPYPLPPDIRRLQNGQYQRLYITKTSGFDVVLAQMPLTTGSITGDIEAGLGLLGLDAWNWITGVFGAKPIPETPLQLKEGTIIYLSDALIAAGLVAIGGSGVSAVLNR